MVRLIRCDEFYLDPHGLRQLGQGFQKKAVMMIAGGYQRYQWKAVTGLGINDGQDVHAVSGKIPVFVAFVSPGTAV